jgi:hypothetical protein
MTALAVAFRPTEEDEQGRRTSVQCTKYVVIIHSMYRCMRLVAEDLGLREAQELRKPCQGPERGSPICVDYVGLVRANAGIVRVEAESVAWRCAGHPSTRRP